MDSSLFNILSAISGVIGTILLALSVNPVFKTAKGLFGIIEKQTKFNLKNHDKMILSGTDEHFENYGLKQGRRMVYLGLFFVAISYILQLLPEFLKPIN